MNSCGCQKPACGCGSTTSCGCNTPQSSTDSPLKKPGVSSAPDAPLKKPGVLGIQGAPLRKPGISSTLPLGWVPDKMTDAGKQVLMPRSMFPVEGQPRLQERLPDARPDLWKCGNTQPTGQGERLGMGAGSLLPKGEGLFFPETQAGTTKGIRLTPLGALDIDKPFGEAAALMLEKALKKAREGGAPALLLPDPEKEIPPSRHGETLRRAVPPPYGNVPPPNVVLPPIGPNGKFEPPWVQYRSEKFPIDEAWTDKYLVALATYLRTGASPPFISPLSGYTSPMVSGTGDTLNALWGTFWNDYQALPTGVIGHLIDSIGCYNLPHSGDTPHYLFWNSGYGAPLTLITYALAMIYMYADEVIDEYSQSNYCDGFNIFIKTLIVGGEAYNKLIPGATDSSQSCRLSIHFKNLTGALGLYGSLWETDDSGLAKSYRTDPPPRCHPEDKCNTGFDLSNPSIAWNDWTPAWRWVTSGEENFFYIAATRPDPDENGNDGEQGVRPDVGTLSFIRGGNFDITAHPAHLAFDGYVCDQIMFQARTLYDYARTTMNPGSIEYLIAMQTAMRISRFALRIIAYWGRFLIHEIGHSYTGSGGHCDSGCCFELASQRWLCKMLGQLELPIDVYYPTGDGDWRTSYDSSETTASNCSEIGTGPTMTCNINRITDSAQFCANTGDPSTICLGGDPNVCS